MLFVLIFLFFFFNDTATTEIYTLSLHDALPISGVTLLPPVIRYPERGRPARVRPGRPRSEEHTSELQSHLNLVCRLLLEKKKKKLKKKNSGNDSALRTSGNRASPDDIVCTFEMH